MSQCIVKDGQSIITQNILPILSALRRYRTRSIRRTRRPSIHTDAQDAATLATALAAIPPGTPGMGSNTQVYKVPGSFNFTVPADIARNYGCKSGVLAAVAVRTIHPQAGGGGGAGRFGATGLVTVTPAQIIPIVVGSGASARQVASGDWRQLFCWRPHVGYWWWRGAAANASFAGQSTHRYCGGDGTGGLFNLKDRPVAKAGTTRAQHGGVPGAAVGGLTTPPRTGSVRRAA